MHGSVVLIAVRHTVPHNEATRARSTPGDPAPGKARHAWPRPRIARWQGLRARGNYQDDLRGAPDENLNQPTRTNARCIAVLDAVPFNDSTAVAASPQVTRLDGSDASTKRRLHGSPLPCTDRHSERPLDRFHIPETQTPRFGLHEGPCPITLECYQHDAPQQRIPHRYVNPCATVGTDRRCDTPSDPCR